jgi:hydroxymethylpyrimidine/phosphomethylpyrimidine kinase
LGSAPKASFTPKVACIVSTSGTPLLDRDGLKALVSALPLFTLLTPNVPEVIAMTGKGVATESDLIEAGHALMDLGARAVLLKGAHLDGDESTDIVLQKGISGPRYFSSRRTHTRNDHGTGCALATSIAAGLAEGIDLPKAVSKGESSCKAFCVDPFTCGTVRNEARWIY